MAIDEEKYNGNDHKVKVHSVLTVVSSVPVNPPDRTIRFTPLDRAMGRHSLHVIFYFPRSGSVDFNRVRPALNEVLTMYPNVTGRLAKDGEGNWMIRCSDAGVRVHHACVGRSVEEWLRCASSDDEKSLCLWEDLPHDPKYWSPFRMQVTDFEGGGTAVAFSCPHIFADPISMTLLVKSWAEAYHNDLIVHPPYLQPQALCVPPTISIPPTTTTATYYASKSKAINPNPNPKVKMVSATFNFSSSAIKQSLAKICSTFPDATPFDLLTAVFWTSITELKAQKDNLKQSISICMDMRKRLHAPLPYGYFGNALHFSQLTMTANKVNSGELGQVAEIVHRHAAGITEEEFWSSLDWLNSRKDDQGMFLPPFTMYGPELTFVNMENMIAPKGTHVNESEPLMYSAAFVKDQKPAHVSYHVENAEGEGLVWVMPSPEEGLARRVTVTLPEEEMEKLLQDEVILTLNPTLLLSARS